MIRSRSYWRLGFLVPFGLALAIVSLATFANDWITEGSSRYLVDRAEIVNVPIAYLDEVVLPVVAEVEKIADPGLLSDADVRYASLNQPGQNWRVAVDCYKHIDPGRRLI